MKNNIIHRIFLCNVREFNNSLLSKMNVHPILHHLYLTFYPFYDILISSKEGKPYKPERTNSMNMDVEKFVDSALELKFKSIEVTKVMDELGYWYSIYEDNSMDDNEYWLDFENESGDTVYFRFIDDIVVGWEF